MSVAPVPQLDSVRIGFLTAEDRVPLLIEPAAGRVDLENWIFEPPEIRRNSPRAFWWHPVSRVQYRIGRRTGETYRSTGRYAAGIPRAFVTAHGSRPSCLHLDRVSSAQVHQSAQRKLLPGQLALENFLSVHDACATWRHDAAR